MNAANKKAAMPKCIAVSFITLFRLLLCLCSIRTLNKRDVGALAHDIADIPERKEPCILSLMLFWNHDRILMFFALVLAW